MLTIPTVFRPKSFEAKHAYKTAQVSLLEEKKASVVQLSRLMELAPSGKKAENVIPTYNAATRGNGAFRSCLLL